MAQKPSFVEDEIYHVYNRGVEKRDVFLQSADYLRFVRCLLEFNDEAPVINFSHRFKLSNEVEPRLDRRRVPPEPLVEILIFTLMPNHFHFLLRQKRENGIVRFMQKLGTGYTMYFNKKYERVGPLFQGSFKAVHVHEEPHFLYLPYYIDTNPLELMGSYRGSTSIEWRKALRFLEQYRWGSFSDYLGRKNFPAVTSRDFLLEFFGGAGGYRKHTESLLQQRLNTTKEMEVIHDVRLDSPIEVPYRGSTLINVEKG